MKMTTVFKYRIGKRWSIHGGPQLNYIYDVQKDARFRRNIDKPITLGFSLGVEYEISDKWSAYIRYMHRFTSGIHPDIGNINGIRVGITYRF